MHVCVCIYPTRRKGLTTITKRRVNGNYPSGQKQRIEHLNITANTQII